MTTSSLDITDVYVLGDKDAVDGTPMMCEKTFRKYLGVPLLGAAHVRGGDTIDFAYQVYTNAYEHARSVDDLF